MNASTPSAEPNWDLYRSFLEVFDCGSLSGAARALGLTQPTLGRHIDALEASIGFALFTRSPSGFIPTDAARALHPYATTLAATAAAAPVESVEGRVERDETRDRTHVLQFGRRAARTRTV